MDATPRDGQGQLLSTPDRIRLPDGTELGLHRMTGDDAAALLRFHDTLSLETTYLRFFTPHPELSAKEVDWFTHVDHVDREAIVVTAGDEIVGVGRFDRLDDLSTAEVAFVVTDPWQGRGIGRVLFEELARQAHQAGVRRFVAETLGHNRRMLTLFHHLGRPVTTSYVGGVVHVVVDLAVPLSTAPMTADG